MISLKSPREIRKMHEAGKLLAICHQHLKKRIRPGVTTFEIDKWVEQFLKQHGATPEQKGYMGYPYATCASVNDEVCHGFPRKTPLKEGDIVCIDMVVNLDGWLADAVSVQVALLFTVAVIAVATYLCRPSRLSRPLPSGLS